MTDEELRKLVAEAKARYDAFTPQQKAEHDHEQRRSFIRGMCPDNRDYDEWCKIVDRTIPPLRRPAPAPEGWRLVPVEATEAMLHAATMEAPTWDDEASRRKYRAMLAAAPSPPQGERTVSEKSQIAAELYKALKALGADVELLSVVGSYGDTLDDADILSCLKDWNASGKVLHAPQ